MKKFLILLGCLFISLNAFAKGPQGVANGVHNFGSTGSGYFNASNEDEVCIFCHTPHGGLLDMPLWNRALPSSTFTHYNSATLSLTNDLSLSNTRAVSQESLLCLSCHDGSVALNSLLNYSNRTGALPDNADNLSTSVFGRPASFLGQGAWIGAAMDGSGTDVGTTLLTDDHPISFSYYRVAEEVVGNNTKFNPTSVAEGAGVRFFPPGVAGAMGNDATKRLECSSCHDPHVDYVANPAYEKFLITPNTGSALCLACHIK